jgi:hypothetical protein
MNDRAEANPPTQCFRFPDDQIIKFDDTVWGGSLRDQYTMESDGSIGERSAAVRQ